MRSRALAGMALTLAAVTSASAQADPPPPPAATCLPARSDSCGEHAKKDREAHAVEPHALPDVITLFNLHTHEAIALDARDVAPDEGRDLERLLRDRTNWESHAVEPACVATIRAACSRLGARRVEIVSGYRSDKLNEMLRKKGHHVARHSQHVLGHAIDFRLVAVPYRELHAFATHTHHGGVGAYPVSQFVHVDVGPERRWSDE